MAAVSSAATTTMRPMHERTTATTPSSSGRTWNDAARIAEHRTLSPAERLRRTIEVSRVTLRFASGRRQ